MDRAGAAWVNGPYSNVPILQVNREMKGIDATGCARYGFARLRHLSCTPYCAVVSRVPRSPRQGPDMTIAQREFDFRSARQRIEAKAKSAGDKLVSLEDAVGRVADGDHVALGGCLYSRTPLALLWGLLRRGPHRLTISRNLMCYEGEWYLVAGAVE